MKGIAMEKIGESVKHTSTNNLYEYMAEGGACCCVILFILSTYTCRRCFWRKNTIQCPLTCVTATEKKFVSENEMYGFQAKATVLKHF